MDDAIVATCRGLEDDALLAAHVAALPARGTKEWRLSSATVWEEW